MERPLQADIFREVARRFKEWHAGPPNLISAVESHQPHPVIAGDSDSTIRECNERIEAKSTKLCASDNVGGALISGWAGRCASLDALPDGLSTALWVAAKRWELRGLWTGGVRWRRNDGQMASITPDDVEKVAKLARLNLPKERVGRFAVQLESILDYVAQIQKVDMTGVEPMAHAVPLHNVLREDVVEPSLPLELVLRNAPETDGAFFKVPKVIGAEEDSAG